MVSPSVPNQKAAGGVLTAKQATRRPRHRPGARSARLGDVPPFYRRPTWNGRTDHVTPQLAAKPPHGPVAASGPAPRQATRLVASRAPSAQPRSPGRPPHAQLLVATGLP